MQKGKTSPLADVANLAFGCLLLFRTFQNGRFTERAADSKEDGAKSAAACLRETRKTFREKRLSSGKAAKGESLLAKRALWGW